MQTCIQELGVVSVQPEPGLTSSVSGPGSGEQVGAYACSLPFGGVRRRPAFSESGRGLSLEIVCVAFSLVTADWFAEGIYWRLDVTFCPVELSLVGNKL